MRDMRRLQPMSVDEHIALHHVMATGEPPQDARVARLVIDRAHDVRWFAVGRRRQIFYLATSVIIAVYLILAVTTVHVPAILLIPVVVTAMLLPFGEGQKRRDAVYARADRAGHVARRFLDERGIEGQP